MIPITARIQAMFTAAPAMPLKPKIAATTAMTRKITAQFSISGLLFKLSERWHYRRSLEAGTTPADVLALIEDASLTIPITVMTYVNPVLRIGADAFFDRARSAGVDGIIVPDVPVDEIDELRASADARDIDTVLLAAPGTTPARLAQIASTARGFVYCVATYGVTGARDALESTAEQVVAGLRPLTDHPLLVGVGIGTPEQAAEACTFADGVIVGSALVAPLLEGRPEETIALASRFRAMIPR